MRDMKTATYRALQCVAASMCAASTISFAQVVAVKSTLSGALLSVGWLDWAAMAIVSLSFGLVSLLQRFKRAEAGDHYVIFVLAHMGGSLISGVIVYLVSRAMVDNPDGFAQALAIGAAGWGGSSFADMWAEKWNKKVTG